METNPKRRTQSLGRACCGALTMHQNLYKTEMTETAMKANTSGAEFQAVGSGIANSAREDASNLIWRGRITRCK
eukprot:482618-Amphidinium_carterae.2